MAIYGKPTDGEVAQNLIKPLTKNFVLFILIEISKITGIIVTQQFQEVPTIVWPQFNGRLRKRVPYVLNGESLKLWYNEHDLFYPEHDPSDHC